MILISVVVRQNEKNLRISLIGNLRLKAKRKYLFPVADIA